MPEVTINTDVKPDPTKDAGNVTVDGNKATVDPNKKPDDKGSESRPAWLPEKFTTPEEMAKAYAELEKKQGQQSQTTDKKDEKKDDTTTVTEPKVDEAASQKATAEIIAVAGGEQGFARVKEWAAANLSAGEIAAYEAALDAGNVEGAKIILGSFTAKYTAATGTDPKLVDGDRASGAGGVTPFGSNEQITAAIRDPRYASDPAYRQEVIKRIDATKTVFREEGWNAGGTPGHRVTLGVS